MEAGQGTQHHDTGRKAVPKPGEANATINSGNGRHGAFASYFNTSISFGQPSHLVESLTLPIGVQLANHDIGGMTDNSAEDTSNITTQETDTSLGQLAILFLGLTHGLINELHCLLKGCELGHSVGNLARPQRVQSLVQTTETLLRDNATPALTEGIRERRESGLHADLDSLHRAQSHIGEELGRGTGP